MPLSEFDEKDRLAAEADGQEPEGAQDEKSGGATGWDPLAPDKLATLHADDSTRRAQEMLDAWYESVKDAVNDSQTIGLFGGRRAGDQSLSRGARLARIKEILSIVRRYDIFHGVTPQGLRRMLEELGPMFVKAGQILSMRSEILPQSFMRELSKLRTDVEPMDRDTVIAALRAEYETPIEELFDALDDRPLGSASVAQVHKARLVTGELVAVKIQRPHVQEIMAQDISIMRSLARYASKFMGDEQFLDLQSVVDELWQSFREETDFLVEARSLEEFRRNNAECRYIECPKPYPALCTRHVVVMDYVEGIPINDTSRLVANGYDLGEIGIKLADNYTSQMLDDGFFHADPHPGNLVVRGGKIVYLDLGIMGRLSSHDRSAVRDMVTAVARCDSAALADGRAESGGESIARHTLHELGFVAPELQVWIEDPIEPGTWFRVDFLWLTEAGRLIIGELDGRQKTGRPELMRGRDALRVMQDERFRESHLTALRPVIIRFPYEVARDPGQLGPLLERYGVPRDSGSWPTEAPRTIVTSSRLDYGGEQLRIVRATTCA